MFDFAVVDVAATVFAAGVTHHFWPLNKTFINHLIYWFVAGFVAHLLFGVRTKLVDLLT